LKALGHTATIVDAAAEVGSVWRTHYDRLHLHTVKKHSNLPGLPYSPDTPKYVPRATFVEYLEGYVAHYALAPRLGVAVAAVERTPQGYRVETSAGPMNVRNVVYATGYNRAPHVPEWPDQSEFAGRIIHSRDYRNGAPFAGEQVLVVGIGNTGGEIAIDLWEHGAQPSICVRSPVHVVPREFLGRSAQESSILLSHLPEQVVSRVSRWIERLILPDLSDLGLERPAVSVREQVIEQGKIPLIDIGTIDLIRQGMIGVVPGIERFSRNGVHVTDGREILCQSVILATGYRPALGDIVPQDAGILDAGGYPRVHGDHDPAWPGLFFVGFANPITGALREAALEAQRIARVIHGRKA